MYTVIFSWLITLLSVTSTSPSPEFRKGTAIATILGRDGVEYTQEITFFTTLSQDEPDDYTIRIRFQSPDNPPILPDNTVSVKFQYAGTDFHYISVSEDEFALEPQTRSPVLAELRSTLSDPLESAMRGKHIFYRLERDGRCRVFSTIVPSGNIKVLVKYIQLEGSYPLGSDRPNFKLRKALTEYFQECPTLANQIANREIHPENFTFMAYNYELHCLE